jgi:fluoroquinolone resistance protein
LFPPSGAVRAVFAHRSRGRGTASIQNILPRETMNDTDTEDRFFHGRTFVQEPVPTGDYEQCRFDNCGFSGADLSEMSFVDCVFTHCDFTMATIANTAFRTVVFKECKLLGFSFERCNKFGLSVAFEGCKMKLASFYKLNLKKTCFQGCDITEADFTEANLSGCVFENCDFTGAVFNNTNLEKADFRTSWGYSINPETNRIWKAKFSLAGIAGLLNSYDIIIE